MKKRFELPIEPPQFICYNHITCANAIIRANIFDNIDKLFCSKYINCYFKESSTKHKFIISIYDNWCTTQKVMQYQLINLSKDIFLSENINVVLMIKKCLLFGSYVFGQCSYNCLVGNGGVDYSLFNYVITGYDDIAHEFTMYGVDNLDNYLCHKIGYEDFINSLYSTNKQNISFSMWRHNKNAEVVIDLQNIIFELEDYINSENRRKHYVEDKIYGLASLKKLGEFFLECAKNKESLSEQYLRKIAIHKYYMKERIRYFVERKLIKKDWLSYSELVEVYGQQILDLGIKYNQIFDTTIVDELTTIIFGIIDIEQNYLTKVLYELKDK